MDTMLGRLSLALMTLALLSACAAGPSTSVPPIGTPPPGVIALRTQAAETPAACPAALIEGVLVRDARSGVGLRDTQGLVRDVLWPNGYSARDEGGRLAVIDGSGKLVAHEGDRVSIGGGEIDANGTWVGCGGTTVLAP
jgi:hypothetical protein